MQRIFSLSVGVPDSKSFGQNTTDGAHRQISNRLVYFPSMAISYQFSVDISGINFSYFVTNSQIKCNALYHAMWNMGAPYMFLLVAIRVKEKGLFR